MRKLLIALSRVFGLLQIYYGLAYITSMLPVVLQVQHSCDDFTTTVATNSYTGYSTAITTGSVIATAFLTFSVAWLLLHKTEWLADRLQFTEQDRLFELSAQVLFSVGAKLLGIAIVAQALPHLFVALGQTITKVRQLADMYGYI